MDKNPIKNCRPDSENDQLRAYAAQLNELTGHYRKEMRQLIRRYRQWQAASNICQIRSFYLQSEGRALQDHMNRIHSLYREAGRDLQAVRRRAKKAEASS